MTFLRTTHANNVCTCNTDRTQHAACYMMLRVHIIGPPSHWSPISLVPQLAPMHPPSHWSPISLVPQCNPGYTVLISPNGMCDAWVLIGGPMGWGTDDFGDQWDGEPMRWGTSERIPMLHVYTRIYLCMLSMLSVGLTTMSRCKMGNTAPPSDDYSYHRCWGISIYQNI